MKTRVLHFVKKPETRNYLLQGKQIKLLVNERVFPPSKHGAFFAENISIKPGEKVIDIGTGTGILAILAAKLGAKAFATDQSTEAINLARQNAERNNVEIEFSQGRFFAGFSQKFDAITANLPQEIVPKAYRKAIGPELTKTIHGGPTGNKPTMELLEKAKHHMHESTRLYLIVYSLNEFLPVLKKIAKEYNTRLVATDPGPTKEFVEDNPEFYQELAKKGKIGLFKENNQWKAIQFVFELKKKCE